MLQIENTFFELGESCDQDCLIICDRGAMDAAACNKIFLYDIINKKTKNGVVGKKYSYYNETKEIKINCLKKTQKNFNKKK